MAPINPVLFSCVICRWGKWSVMITSLLKTPINRSEVHPIPIPSITAEKKKEKDLIITLPIRFISAKNREPQEQGVCGGMLCVCGILHADGSVIKKPPLCTVCVYIVFRLIIIKYKKCVGAFTTIIKLIKMCFCIGCAML